MLKKALILLLLWPFLLPPGFCLCRLDRLGLRASGAAAREESEPVPRCSCCRHKRPAPSPRLDEARPDVPHSPSCPAHHSWEVARTFAPSSHLDDLVPLPPCELPSQEGVAACPSALLILLPLRSSGTSTPLYLSCRDLLC
ncbi:MAG: hypothetical protein U0797_10230 [Gemmataceae bacterium]